MYRSSHHGLGWAILLRRYVELIGLRAALVPVLTPFTKTSNNQIPARDVRLVWWYGRRWAANGLNI